MKQTIFLLGLFLAILLPQLSKTNSIVFDCKLNNTFISSDTLVPQDTIEFTLNVYENTTPAYYNFEGDTTKRNIFYVHHKKGNYNIHHIIDYKLDFWSMYDSKDVIILDTIEFYKYQKN
jgi:hypothetical protein